MDNLIFKSLIQNKAYAQEVFSYMEPEYFGTPEKQRLFKIYKDIWIKHNSLPTKEVFYAEIERLSINDTEYKACLNEIDESFSPIEPVSMDYLIEKSEDWILEKRVHKAIVNGIQEFGEDVPNFGKTYDELREAISFSFDKTIGLTYMDDADKRFDLYHQKITKHSFGLEVLDKVTEGGYENGTLNVVLAPSGGGKSIFGLNMLLTSLKEGKNVLYITLELSEANVLRRADANLLNIPVGDVRKLDKPTFDDKMSMLSEKIKGELLVKQYPTKMASVLHFRHLLEELKIKKNWKPDVIFVDYIGICGSATAPRGSNSYTQLQHVTEELRGLAVEYDVPVWSAHQINRAGYDDSDIGLDKVADSMGIAFTADFVCSIFSNPELEEMKVANAKILKNRYGEVGSTYKVGLDKARMKFYNVPNTPEQGKQNAPNQLMTNDNFDTGISNLIEKSKGFSDFKFG